MQDANPFFIWELHGNIKLVRDYVQCLTSTSYWRKHMQELKAVEILAREWQQKTTALGQTW